MADRHDNRVTVMLGGAGYELCASKLAERTYGDRFRADVGALGESGVTTVLRDRDGNPVMEGKGKDARPKVAPVPYTGRFRSDIAISAAKGVTLFGEDMPTQVVAAAWAMARAAGSTDLPWEGWLEMWDQLPSNAQEDLDLWRAVCEDLASRAIFRGFGGPSDAGQPDEGEAEQG